MKTQQPNPALDLEALAEKLAAFDFTLEVPESNRYLLIFQEQYYQIDQVSYVVLESIKNGTDLCATLKHAFPSIDLSTNDLRVLINHLTKQVLPLLENETPPKKKSVKELFTLVHPSAILPFTRGLSFLFNPRLFYPLLLLAVILNSAFWFLVKYQVLHFKGQGYLGTEAYLGYLIAIFGFLLLHEFGHATASMVMGKAPGKIGVGIYFVFPAFFTDLTAIWSLKRHQRIVINLGGIYLQLLINLLMMLILIVFQGSPSLVSFMLRIIGFNILISLYNINPFFKFDGYWIYSDFFKLPNLRQQSNELLRSLFFAIPKFLFKSRLKTNFRGLSSPPLFTYTILYFVFMVFVWYLLLRFIVRTHLKFWHSLQEIGPFEWNDFHAWKQLAGPILILLFCWMIVYFRFAPTFKFRKYANRIS
jgi:putative peptide zinc metalloprotease protein